MVPNPRKVAVMYTLVAACVSESEEEAEKPGYDARHRVTLRLLALWFDMEWAKVAAMEMMVAYMAMAAEKEMEKKDPEKKSRWKKWKRGGIIGAAAVTGGALLFVTGGPIIPYTSSIVSFTLKENLDLISVLYDWYMIVWLRDSMVCLLLCRFGSAGHSGRNGSGSGGNTSSRCQWTNGRGRSGWLRRYRLYCCCRFFWRYLNLLAS